MPSKKHNYHHSMKNDNFQGEKGKSAVKFKEDRSKYKMCLRKLDWVDDLPEDRQEKVALSLLSNASSIQL